jgi:hypothetical protein
MLTDLSKAFEEALGRHAREQPPVSPPLRLRLVSCKPYLLEDSTGLQVEIDQYHLEAVLRDCLEINCLVVLQEWKLDIELKGRKVEFITVNSGHVAL